MHAPVDILGLSPDGLTAACGQWGQKAFRARQLLRWVHQRGESDFSRMTDLAREFRDLLALRARVDPECVLQSDLQRRLSLP